MTDNIYDAIVVGTGASGGWATKELCEKGLKTLVLERGRMVKHIVDYPTMFKDPWDFENGGHFTQAELKKRGGGGNKYDAHFFVDNASHPYQSVGENNYQWIRGYQVGGRSLTWARHSYRRSEIDFEANLKDGHGCDWPVRYKDIEPWYAYVENHIGVSGEKLGLKQLPDSVFLKPMTLNCIEEHLRHGLKKEFNRTLTIGRVAHITEGTKPGAGRAICQFRNRCGRGCPYGAYYSSLSSTLPMAEATGNMTLRPNSIVYEIIYDKDKKKATGLTVIDAETKQTYTYKAKIIFLCASTVNSTFILLNSKSNRFPNGLGNDSAELGHNFMDHCGRAGATGVHEGFQDKYYKGRSPSGIYVPRFRNIGGDTNSKNFVRGYGYQGGGFREDWLDAIREACYGEKLKEGILAPGMWQMGLGGSGETLPYHDNKLFLNYDKKDQWGLPTITFDVKLRENEYKMLDDMAEQAAMMLERAGFKNVTMTKKATIGSVHEMGTARMGKDPKTSVLNKYNQVWHCENVFVTDGAAMASASCVNPTLSFMAFTARATNYAVEELKKRNL